MHLSLWKWICFDAPLRLASAGLAYPSRNPSTKGSGWESVEGQKVGCISQAAARRKRPSRRRAAEQRYELAAFHSMTSSARNRTDCGTAIPSVLAVLRLIARTNFVGCSIGMSPGLAPFRILSTKLAARQAAVDLGRKLSSPIAPKPQPMQKAFGGHDRNATTSPVLARFLCCRTN
jgi:hypothetical protein